MSNRKTKGSEEGKQKMTLDSRKAKHGFSGTPAGRLTWDAEGQKSTGQLVRQRQAH